MKTLIGFLTFVFSVSVIAAAEQYSVEIMKARTKFIIRKQIELRPTAKDRNILFAHLEYRLAYPSEKTGDQNTWPKLMVSHAAGGASISGCELRLKSEGKEKDILYPGEQWEIVLSSRTDLSSKKMGKTVIKFGHPDEPPSLEFTIRSYETKFKLKGAHSSNAELVCKNSCKDLRGVISTKKCEEHIESSTREVLAALGVSYMQEKSQGKDNVVAREVPKAQPAQAAQ